MQTGIPPRYLHGLHSSLLLFSLTWIIRVVSYWLSAATFDTLPPSPFYYQHSDCIKFAKRSSGYHSLAQKPVMAPISLVLSVLSMTYKVLLIGPSKRPYLLPRSS